MKDKIIIIVLILIVTPIAIIPKPETKKIISNTNQINSNINLDNGDEKINWDSLKTTTINLNNNSLKITKGGTYHLSGSIANGNITISTLEDVKLVLHSININTTKDPAILIEKANNTVIELSPNSINTISNNQEYYNTNYDGCIYSKGDLIFQGDGTLNITSNSLSAIVSKDDLKIKAGTYNLISNDDGIKAKDSVYIKKGNFTIKVKGNGIKATNSTNPLKGYINIEDGSFNITSNKDGIEATTKLIIQNGSFAITTTKSKKSSKALKANDNLIIENGNFNINSYDDAIHSNTIIGIKKGTININTQNTGIHADETIIIDDGIITINKANEGITSQQLTINNGTIYLEGVTKNTTTFNINKGKLISLTNSNINPQFLSSSKQYSLFFNLPTTYNKNIKLLDPDNNIIIDYTPTQKYNSILISTNEITFANTYTLKINNKKITSLTAIDIITTNN